MCVCLHLLQVKRWGTGIRGLTRGLATLLRGKQKPLVVKDYVWRPQVSFGWASLQNVILYPSVLWHSWLGDRKGIRPVKSWVLVCWQWHLTGALHTLQLQLSPPPPSSLTPIKSRTETSQYRLSGVVLGNVECHSVVIVTRGIFQKNDNLL